MLNVLNLALPVINQVVKDHGFEYRTYISDATSAYGIVTPTYSAWQTCDGSVQPQEASIFEMDGTEPAKKGITVWAKINFKTLDEQEHCDQVRYMGKVYNCQSCTNWYGPNGWRTFSCVEDKYKGTWNDTSTTPTGGAEYV